MNSLLVLLAQLTPKELMEAKLRAKSSAWTGEAAIICGAIAVVTLLLAAWALFIRKRAGRERSRYEGPRVGMGKPSRNKTAPHGDEPAPGSQTKAVRSDGRRKKRRRRREHRPRNPTLAETGGLPPVRPNEPPDLD